MRAGLQQLGLRSCHGIIRKAAGLLANGRVARQQQTWWNWLKLGMVASANHDNPSSNAMTQDVGMQCPRAPVHRVTIPLVSTCDAGSNVLPLSVKPA